MQGDDTEQLRLLERAVGGDRCAFGRLFAMQDWWLSPHARQLLHEKEGLTSCDPEDLVQEVAARTWKGLPTFVLPLEPQQRAASFRQFLITTMRNHFTDLMNSAHKRYLTLESLLFGPDDAGLDQARAAALRTPSSAAGTAEAVAQIRKCLEALPPRYRRVLEMQYMDGMSYSAIASGNEMSEQAVKGVLDRARKQMRECMVRSSLWFSSGRG
jgi:RNA polymerase sigma factor (sigma-70 family)